LLEDAIPYLLEGEAALARNPEHSLAAMIDAIASGAADLHLVFRGDEYQGFVVTYGERKAVTQMVIWKLWGKTGSYRHHWKQLSPWLNDLARKYGAERIVFASPRRGFDRKAREMGFQYIHTFYGRPVDG